MLIDSEGNASSNGRFLCLCKKVFFVSTFCMFAIHLRLYSLFQDGRHGLRENILLNFDFMYEVTSTNLQVNKKYSNGGNFGIRCIAIVIQ